VAEKEKSNIYQEVQGQEKEARKSFVVQVEEVWRFTEQVEVEAISREDAEELAQEQFKEAGISWDDGNPLDRHATTLTENGQPLPQQTEGQEQGAGKPVQALGLVLAYEQRDALSDVLDYLWETESEDYAANPTPNHIYQKLIRLREFCGPQQDAETNTENAEPDHEPVTEQRSVMNQYERNLKRLRELLPKGRDHIAIENPPFMRLVVERVSENQISLCHYGEQNGDLMRDPEVVLVIEGSEAKPVYFRNDYAGVEHATQEGLFGDVPVKPQRQKDLDVFVSMWLRNLRDQGFLERAQQLKAEKPEVEVTSSESESTTETTGETMSEAKTEKQMNQKQQNGKEPIAQMELGKLRGEVYRQQSDRGEYYSVAVRRPFTGKDGTEKLAFDTREQDIRDHIAILQEAEKIIHEEKQERAKEHGQTEASRIRVTRER
jgi:hypothetical protein